MKTKHLLIIFVIVFISIHEIIGQNTDKLLLVYKRWQYIATYNYETGEENKMLDIANSELLVTDSILLTDSAFYFQIRKNIHNTYGWSVNDKKYSYNLSEKRTDFICEYIFKGIDTLQCTRIDNMNIVTTFNVYDNIRPLNIGGYGYQHVSNMVDSVSILSKYGILYLLKDTVPIKLLAPNKRIYAKFGVQGFHYPFLTANGKYVYFWDISKGNLFNKGNIKRLELGTMLMQTIEINEIPGYLSGTKDGSYLIYQNGYYNWKMFSLETYQKKQLPKYEWVRPLFYYDENNRLSKNQLNYFNKLLITRRLLK